MDKRISLLNSIKSRLKKLVTNKNIVDEDEKLGTLECARLKANMINDNILSGLVVNERTFYGNKAYAESSQGKISYHIYPIIGKASKSYTRKFEYSVQDEEHIDGEKQIARR